MLKIVFMGTPEFAVPALEAVAKAHEVLHVYTQPDRPVGRGLEVRQSAVKQAALKLGIPVRQPEKLSQPGEFEFLSALKPDLILIVAYGQILRRNVLDLPRLGCVNIHSSLLPRWRGAAPIQWAILGGDSVSGVTTMRLVEKLDAGDILLQKETPISGSDTGGTLHDRLAAIGAELILPTLSGLEDGSLKGRAQDESAVTYASKLTKEMEAIAPASETAQVVDRKIRALNPWPGTSVWVKLTKDGASERLKIKRASLRLDVQGPAGSIFERSGMVAIGCSAGSIELHEVQWDGKKAVDAAAFLNGLKGRGISLPLMLG
ncbi:MAG: methionyl-tRNA formyltransferase [Bdellovibrionales bacterium]|nr:methionyl-tRNA formyltransferase [Bdellovibrionales bacterium]